MGKHHHKNQNTANNRAKIFQAVDQKADKYGNRRRQHDAVADIEPKTAGQPRDEHGRLTQIK